MFMKSLQQMIVVPLLVHTHLHLPHHMEVLCNIPYDDGTKLQMFNLVVDIIDFILCEVKYVKYNMWSKTFTWHSNNYVLKLVKI